MSAISRGSIINTVHFQTQCLIYFYKQAITLLISSLKLECLTPNVNLDCNSHNLFKTEDS